MGTYSLASKAFDDLDEILEFVRRDKPQAADRLLLLFEEKFALLATSPAAGDLRLEYGDGVRSAIVGRFVIYYREEKYGILSPLRRAQYEAAMKSYCDVAAQQVTPESALPSAAGAMHSSRRRTRRSRSVAPSRRS